MMISKLKKTIINKEIKSCQLSFFLWGKKQIIENNHLNIKRRDGKAKQQREEEEEKKKDKQFVNVCYFIFLPLDTDYRLWQQVTTALSGYFLA